MVAPPHYYERYAPSRPLVTELLPGIDRVSRAEAFCSRLILRVKCPASYLQVLALLLGHGGYHSNRVWASHWHIADLARRVCGWRVSAESGAKTVKRAIDYWCSLGLLRKITDQEELLAGPGEHDWIDRGGKKKGEGQVNHYDISGMAAVQPVAFVEAVDALIEGHQYRPPRTDPEMARNLDTRYPDPFQDTEADAAADAELTEAGIPDPFESVSADNYSVTERPLISTPLIKRTLDIAAPAASLRNVEMSDKNAAKNDAEKAPSDGAAIPGFNRSKLSPITKTYTHVRGVIEKAVKKPAQRSMADEIRRLHFERGVDVGMAIKMRRTMGEKWCRALLVYGREEGAAQGRTLPPGWYTGVWKNWQTDPTSAWDDDLQRVIDREESEWNRALAIREAASAPPSLPNPSDKPALGAEAATSPVWKGPKPTPPPPKPNPKPAEPQPPATEPPPVPAALLAAWPAFLRGIKEVLPVPFWEAHIARGGITPGQMQTQTNGDVLVMVVAAKAFTHATLRSKPFHVQTMKQVLAEALGVDAGRLTLEIGGPPHA